MQGGGHGPVIHNRAGDPQERSLPGGARLRVGSASLHPAGVRSGGGGRGRPDGPVTGYSGESGTDPRGDGVPGGDGGPCPFPRHTGPRATGSGDLFPLEAQGAKSQACRETHGGDPHDQDPQARDGLAARENPPRRGDEAASAISRGRRRRRSRRRRGRSCEVPDGNRRPFSEGILVGPERQGTGGRGQRAFPDPDPGVGGGDGEGARGPGFLRASAVGDRPVPDGVEDGSPADPVDRRGAEGAASRMGCLRSGPRRPCSFGLAGVSRFRALFAGVVPPRRGGDGDPGIAGPETEDDGVPGLAGSVPGGRLARSEGVGQRPGRRGSRGGHVRSPESGSGLTWAGRISSSSWWAQSWSCTSFCTTVSSSSSCSSHSGRSADGCGAGHTGTWTLCTDRPSRPPSRSSFPPTTRKRRSSSPSRRSSVFVSPAWRSSWSTTARRTARSAGSSGNSVSAGWRSPTRNGFRPAPCAVFTNCGGGCAPGE